MIYGKKIKPFLCFKNLSIAHFIKKEKKKKEVLLNLYKVRDEERIHVFWTTGSRNNKIRDR